jgi:HEAT repeat protein
MDVKTVVSALMKASRAQEERLSYCAIRAVGNIGANDKTAAVRIVPLLVRVFENTEEKITNRGTAAYYLGRIGPQAKCAVPVFLKALRAKAKPDDPTAKHIRDSVLYGLTLLGPVAKEAVPDLMVILLNYKLPYGERQRAAEALGSIGPAARPAIPALRKALKDKDNMVREAAVRALEKVSSNSAKKPSQTRTRTTWFAKLLFSFWKR